MMPTIMTNDVRRDQLFGSGLVFSTGLVWFFVQAWIFAIQARTVWLIVLLTITTTVAILSQGYLCAIFVSIPPDPKPRGVTQVNREAFASFPFDATASLIRRKGSKTGPSIGWELRSAEEMGRAPLARPDSAAAASTTAVIGGGGGVCKDDDDDRRPDVSSVGNRRARSLHSKENGAENRCYAGPAEAAVGGRGKFGGEECPAGCPAKEGEALMLSTSPPGRRGMSPGGGQGGFETSLIGPSEGGTGVAEVAVAAAATAGAGSCVEDVVESGRAEPFHFDRSKRTLPPLGQLLLGQGEREVERGREGRSEECVFGGKLDGGDTTGDLSNRKQDFHCNHNRRLYHQHHGYHHHHSRHLSQEMRGSWGRAGSGQTEATVPSSENNASFDTNNDEKAVFGAIDAKAKVSGKGLLGSDDRAESSADGCCSETACVGCKACSERKEGLERETTAAAGVMLSYLDLEDRGEKPIPSPVSGGGGGGGTRLSNEPVVRVSELPDVCAICLGQYANGEEVHVLPCLHMFHAQCLDVWIVGHPSCPYCKGDLNVLPQESCPHAETSAAAFATSVCSEIASFFTWPLMRFREYRERRRQQQRRRQQERQQQQQQQQHRALGQGGFGGRRGWDNDERGVVDFAVSPSVSTAAASPIVPMTMVAA